MLINPGSANEYTLRTNVVNSIHKGIESYVEFNILKYQDKNSKKGLSVFNSLVLIDVKYTTREFKGNRVESAAKYINRIGVSYAARNVSGQVLPVDVTTTIQVLDKILDIFKKFLLRLP